MGNELITRRAPLAASSWNPEERTLEVVFSTGAPVERADARGAYVERLSLEQDWSGFVGRPVLNTHQRGDLSDVLGHVVKAWTVSPTEARAVIKLSRRPDVEAVVQDVLDGHLRGVSVGYSVSEWSETKEGGTRVKTATRWSPLELSIVPIAADAGATIRSNPMPETIEAGAVQDRAAINSEIRSIARVAGLDQNFVDVQIDANATIEEARAAAFEAMKTRSAPAATVRSTGHVTLDDPQTRAQAMGEAILCRVDPSHQPSGPARAYVGLSLPEMARESLRRSGASVTGLGTAEVVTRALGGLHSTSDFALALSDSIGRVLAQSYSAAPSGLKPLARQVTLPDFRTRSFVRMSGLSDLEPVNEHGEFKRGTLDEAGETLKLGTFGKVFGITRQAIVNDDLGALADIPRKLGEAAARFEADKLAAALLSNPTMGDGKALFHASHGNLAASGAAPAEATLSAARVAMRGQTDGAGFLIAVTPKYLVVGPALETDAEKLLAAIQPTQTSDVQPIRLTLLVEPRLSGKGWFVVDPAVDGLVYAHLAGEPGPQVESRTGFDVDGIETRVRLDFGASFVDHCGWFKNAGAA